MLQHERRQPNDRSTMAVSDPVEPVSESPPGPETCRVCIASAVIGIGTHHNVIVVNPAAESLTGIRANDTLHQPYEVLPPPLVELVREALILGKSVPDRQIVLAPQAGKTVTLRVSALRCEVDDSKDPSLILLIEDLTAAAELDSNMRRLDRLASIGTLSASMAHEIKNALVAIKTFLDLLLANNPQNELAELVSSEILRIDAIVSQMLKFAGPAKPTFAPISVHEILDRSIRLLEPKVHSHRLSLEKKMGARADRVHGDPYQLEQAFINLLLNALESTQPGGVLTVTTENAPAPSPAPSHDEFVVAFSDTGTGIDSQNLKRLFEPFFTTKTTGTGLGLPITRRIIREHAGDIDVTSQPARGSTFRVRLPLWNPQNT